MRAWQPAVGDWVIYRPHPGAMAEDGEVTALIKEGMVRVRYRGDITAKATRVVDLMHGGRDPRRRDIGGDGASRPEKGQP